MSSTCTKYPTAQDPCRIRFPAGLTIEGVADIGDDDFDRGLALFRAMSPALAALAPVFALINALLGLKKFVGAFTSFPPDLVELAEGIDEFLTAVNKLIAVAPPVSVPILIKDLLTCMITFLSGMFARLQALQREVARIEAARQKALDLNLPDLDSLMDCAEENIERFLLHLSKTMGSMSTVFAVMQSFADVAGIELPGVDFDVSGSLDEALDKLGEIIFTLSDILEAIDP